MSSRFTSRTTNSTGGGGTYINIQTGFDPSAPAPSGEDINAPVNNQPMNRGASLFDQMGAWQQGDASNHHPPAAGNLPRDPPDNLSNMQGPYGGGAHAERGGDRERNDRYSRRTHDHPGRREDEPYRTTSPWPARLYRRNNDRRDHPQPDPYHRSQPHERFQYDQRSDDSRAGRPESRHARPQPGGHADYQPSHVSGGYNDIDQRRPHSRERVDAHESRRQSSHPRGHDNMGYQNDAPFIPYTPRQDGYASSSRSTNIDRDRRQPSSVEDHERRPHGTGNVGGRERAADSYSYDPPYVRRPPYPRQGESAGDNRNSREPSNRFTPPRFHPPEQYRDSRYYENDTPVQTSPSRRTASEYEGADSSCRHQGAREADGGYGQARPGHEHVRDEAGTRQSRAYGRDNPPAGPGRRPYGESSPHQNGMPRQDLPRRGSGFEYNGASRFHRHPNPYPQVPESTDRYGDNRQGRDDGYEGAPPPPRGNHPHHQAHQYPDLADVRNRNSGTGQAQNGTRAGPQAHQAAVNNTDNGPQQGGGSDAGPVHDDIRGRRRARNSVHFPPDLPPDHEEDRQPEPARRQSRSTRRHHPPPQDGRNDIGKGYRLSRERAFEVPRPDPAHEPAQGLGGFSGRRPRAPSVSTRAGSVSTQASSVASRESWHYLPSGMIKVVERDGKKQKYQVRRKK